MNATEPLPIKGARGKVEVTNPEGIFYKVLIDGEAQRQVKGRWLIPMRNGDSAELRARGFLPGFQKLYLQGEKVYEFGTEATIVHKILVFLPALLIILNPLFGTVLAILMFFMNIAIVKNPEMPSALRYALPVINTIAVGLAMLLITGMFR